MAHYRTRMARGERGVPIPPKPRKRRRQRSAETVAKTAASRLGIAAHKYQANVEAGRKWCSGHQVWHTLATTPWTQRRSAGSGLAGYCRAWGREYQAARQVS